MRNITEHTGKLRLIKRLKNSINGNPRFELAIMDDTQSGLGWTFKTGVDSAHGYEVPNYMDRDVDVTVTIGTHYRSATLNSICRA